MTPDEQIDFIKSALQRNPKLTKFHFTAKCGMSQRIVKQLEDDGTRFGSSVSYREIWRNTKINKGTV